MKKIKNLFNSKAAYIVDQFLLPAVVATAALGVGTLVLNGGDFSSDSDKAFAFLGMAEALALAGVSGMIAMYSYNGKSIITPVFERLANRLEDPKNNEILQKKNPIGFMAGRIGDDIKEEVADIADTNILKTGYRHIASRFNKNVEPPKKEVLYRVGFNRGTITKEQRLQEANEVGKSLAKVGFRPPSKR